MICLVYCIVSLFYYVFVLSPAPTWYIILLLWCARYSLFVLKVPLNPKQTNKHCSATLLTRRQWDMIKCLCFWHFICVINLLNLFIQGLVLSCKVHDFLVKSDTWGTSWMSTVITSVTEFSFGSQNAGCATLVCHIMQSTVISSFFCIGIFNWYNIGQMLIGQLTLDRCCTNVQTCIGPT